MGAVGQMDAGANGNAARKIFATAGETDADERLGIGEHIAPQGGRQARQIALLLHGKQQFLGAKAAGGHNHMGGGVVLLRLPERLNGDAPAAAAVLRGAQRCNAGNAALRQHLRALPFGQIEIVVIEGVFGTITTAHHAAAASGAGLARRAVAIKVGVAVVRRMGVLVVGAEIHAHTGGVKAVADTGCAGQPLQGVVGIGQNGVGGNAEHGFGALIMGGHDVAPRTQTRPSAVLPHAGIRHQQGIGISDGAAAHGVAVQHQHVFKQAQGEKTTAGQRRQPQKTAHVPSAGGHIGRAEAAALLGHGNAVAFFGQPQGRHAAAKAGANDKVIGVERRVHGGVLKRLPETAATP